MENEIWVKINGFENYEVSNFGRIKSLPKKTRKGERILKKIIVCGGYESIDFVKDKKVYKKLVHRIVAENFIKNHENKIQVNHVNGIKADNRVENLEWNTRSENQLHSIRIGLRTTKGIKNSQAKLNEKMVLEIFNDDRKYKHIKEDYKISIPTISDIKRGGSWTHITGMINIKHGNRNQVLTVK